MQTTIDVSKTFIGDVRQRQRSYKQS